MPQMLNLTCYQDSSHLRQTSSLNLLLGLGGELKFSNFGCGTHNLEFRHPSAHSLDDSTEHNFRRKGHYMKCLTISLDWPWVDATHIERFSYHAPGVLEFNSSAVQLLSRPQACTISTSVFEIPILQRSLREPENSLCLLKSFGIPLRHR